QDNAAQYPDYVEFVSSSGCASYIGRRGGRQSIWLSTACSVGNVIHELGHALGLYHEQARGDRNSFVSIQWQNIITGKEHNFEQQLTNAADNGDYDYQSIMHYGSYFFSSNGSPTILTTNPPGAIIGQRVALSSGDIQALAELYATDLAVTIQATQSIIDPGAMLSASVYVTNLQANSARDVRLTISDNESAAFVGSQAEGWTCYPVDFSTMCDLDELLGNSHSSLELYFTAPAFGFPWSVTAQISSAGNDNNNSNDSDNIEVIVNSQNFAPVIQPDQVFNVYHLSASGLSIGHIEALDFNGDALGDFSIVTGVLRDSLDINPNTGELFVVNSSLWDIGTTPEFDVGIVASDGEFISSIETVRIKLRETENLQSSDNGTSSLSLLFVFVGGILVRLRSRLFQKHEANNRLHYLSLPSQLTRRGLQHSCYIGTTIS
ncbi:MAG: M12 family metallopeptidase, partial [Pseudomonadota bacterium]